MGITNWSALKSDGTIADTPASCFRYRIAEEFRVQLRDLITNINTDDRWLLRIETPDGQTIFRQMVTLRIGGMGQMGMFFAWWHNGETIETTVFGAESRQTTLLQSIGPTDTTLRVADASGWPQPSGACEIDGETITYAERARLETHWELRGCSRGQAGTTAATHGAGSRVVDTSGLGHIMAETTLAAAVDAQATEIPAEDLREFPAAGSAYMAVRASNGRLSGTPERIDYTTVDTSSWPHKLLGCTRGRLGRSRQAHAAGDVLIEAPAIQIGTDVGIADPGGGSDMTWREGIIMFDWEGPVYALALSGGSRVIFAGHWSGSASLPMNLNIVSTAVCGGNTWSALHMPETGYWWVADSSSGNGVQVTAGADPRAVGADAEPRFGSAEWSPQQAFSGSTETSSSCSNPILLRRGLRPVLLYAKTDGTYCEEAVVGGQLENPVKITDKQVVAAAIDGAGDMVMIAVSGSATSVLTAAPNPMDDRDFMAPGRVQEITPMLLNASTGALEAFPAIPAGIHRLEVRGPGHYRLLTSDGNYYDTQDAGRTWSA